IALFEAIPVKKTSRPKVAIFGDLYVRDNDVFNQGLIRTIEENGGEVITTPYNEYLKIIAGSYLKKWISEGYYAQAVRAKLSQKTISIIEKKYYKYFNKILGEPQHNFRVSPGEILSKLNVKNQNTGESMDNLLKIFSLIEQYPDISLFVQTNPSYCCPSLITEAMAAEIERLTGVPVVTIEYDGTEGTRNDVVIPYLKYARK
ncbi:MAG: CoA activase, partial [bacterium]|nr:CoA activase [bacterium]